MLFLDSSDPKEIKNIVALGVISGITTNPLIIAKEAGNVDLERRIKEVVEVSRGDVSVELTTESEGEMLDEAAKYHDWKPDRICIKVPFSETGLRVLHVLASRGVRTNVTCLMAMNQAYLASLAGATYVSLFSGRIRDMGYDVRPVISGTRKLLDVERLASKIIVGSIRHMMDFNEALECGAHIVTVPPAILRKMLWNPRNGRNDPRVQHGMGKTAASRDLDSLSSRFAVDREYISSLPTRRGALDKIAPKNSSRARQLGASKSVALHH